MKASITYMRGPRIPDHVISEETIPVGSDDMDMILDQIANHHIHFNPRPADCIEVRIVIGEPPPWR